MATELESALGGVYSVMSVEFQLPLVKLVMNQMQKAGEIDALPQKSVEPVIVTGIEALGRSHELMRLTQGVQMAVAILGPEIVARRLKDGALISKIFTGTGVDADGLLKTDEEMAAEMQQAQQQATIEKLGGPAIKAFTDGSIANAQIQSQKEQATE